MDAIASVSGVGAVAGLVSFTGSTSTTVTNVEDDVSIQALKLIQAAVANTPTGVQHLDLKA